MFRVKQIEAAFLPFEAAHSFRMLIAQMLHLAKQMVTLVLQGVDLRVLCVELVFNLVLHDVDAFNSFFGRGNFSFHISNLSQDSIDVDARHSVRFSSATLGHDDDLLLACEQFQTLEEFLALLVRPVELLIQVSVKLLLAVVLVLDLVAHDGIQILETSAAGGLLKVPYELHLLGQFAGEIPLVGLELVELQEVLVELLDELLLLALEGLDGAVDLVASTHGEVAF